MQKFRKIIGYYALIPFLVSIPFLLVNLFYPEPFVEVIGVPLLAGLIHWFRGKKNDKKEALIMAETGASINSFLLLVLTAIFTIMMVLAKGNVQGSLMMNFGWFLFPFAPLMLLAMLMDQMLLVYLTAFLTYLVGWIVCLWKASVLCGKLRSESQNETNLENDLTQQPVKKAYLAMLVSCFLCLGISTYFYANRPAVKYGGHGFQYMNGYSSTDFTDYTVYAQNSKLVTLDHEPSLLIENEQDMPILDGAEACYPLYAAFAKAVYKDIDQIEMNCDQDTLRSQNGKIVTFTNTIQGIDRLIRGGIKQDPMDGQGEMEDDNQTDEQANDQTDEQTDDQDGTIVDVAIEEFGDDGIDMFFGARPSQDQYLMAQEYGVDLEVTPIGREAFVFFVEEGNPVESLTSEDLRSIYHGDINDWAVLGGKNQKIRAFQRPEGSGSQTMMAYFMGDTPLKKPETYEVVSAMEGVINEVAQYANEEGAMGYTFRYFLEELNQEKGVKMLSVDGVYPTVETIEDGTYPLTVDLCLITRKNDPNPFVQKMKEFILSEDGQTIIRETGYGGATSCEIP